jgi:hypothetical protein
MSYENSGKLLGLYDKLVECEIIENVTKEESKSASHDGDGGLLFENGQVSAGKHRALIFC